MGAGLKRTSADTIEFTKDAATSFLEDYQVFEEVDRPLRDSHVRYLIKSMMRGTFVPEWVQLRVCLCREPYAGQPAGTVWRMNGQHTAWARLDLPASYRCPVTLEKWTARTVDDMRQLYAQIDRNAPRTKANVIQSWIGGTGEYANVPKSVIRNIAAALQYYLWEDEAFRRGHDGDEVAYLMRTDHYDICAKVVKFLGEHPNNRDNKHIWRAPVMGAMLATMEKAPIISDRFWSTVASGTGIESKTDPRLKLRNALINSSIQSGGGMRTGKSMVTGEGVYRWCLSCWNAHRAGREIASLRNPQERPKVK